MEGSVIPFESLCVDCAGEVKRGETKETATGGKNCPNRRIEGCRLSAVFDTLLAARRDQVLGSWHPRIKAAEGAIRNAGARMADRRSGKRSNL